MLISPPPPPPIIDPEDADDNSIHVSPGTFYAWSSMFIMFVLSIPASSVVVFLRHHFGCRFIKLYMILVAFGLLWTMYSFDSPFNLRPTPARIFAAAMVAVAIYHYREAWARFWSSAGHPEKLWHSLNDGIPWLGQLFPTVGERALKTLLEPAVPALLGVICVIAGIGGESYFRVRLGMFSMWLFTAAVCHMLLESMLYEQRLHKIIDVIDSNIEGAQMQEVITTFTEGKAVVDSPESRMGNPVVFTPDLFKVMQTARQRKEKTRPTAQAATAAAGAAQG